VDDRPKGGPSDEKWRSDLSSSLRRLNEQLAKADWRRELASNMRHVTEEIARGIAQETIYHASRALDRATERRLEHERKLAERKESKRARKAARRRERLELRMAQTNVFEGYVQVIAAVVMVCFLFLQPHLWWLVFPALALGTRGARTIGYKREQRALSQPETRVSEPVRTAVDPRAARIDEICNKLLAALKDAPAAVRDFLSTPEQTVEMLRKSCHDLLKRELELRALATPEDSARLDRERVTLQARVAAESDDVVRVRLQGALVALDNQQRQQTEMLKSGPGSATPSMGCTRRSCG